MLLLQSRHLLLRLLCRQALNLQDLGAKLWAGTALTLAALNMKFLGVVYKKSDDAYVWASSLAAGGPMYSALYWNG